MKLKLTSAFLFFVQFAFEQDRIQKIESLLNSLYLAETFNGNVLIAEKGGISHLVLIHGGNKTEAKRKK
jgi:hypothetical protein